MTPMPLGQFRKLDVLAVLTGPSLPASLACKPAAQHTLGYAALARYAHQWAAVLEVGAQQPSAGNRLIPLRLGQA
jgi:hypothetical protein